MTEIQDVVIVTGLSGAGKSTVLRALSDIGFYCIDNLPPPLVSQTVRECRDSGIERVALGMDVRVGAFLDTAAHSLSDLEEEIEHLSILFLEAADEVLVRRYSETRRPHPVFALPGVIESQQEVPRSERSVIQGVTLERQRLAQLRKLSTLQIDTTHDSVHELRRQIMAIFKAPSAGARPMVVRFLSFGFKHGVPIDADIVFDVRFLDNPYFVPALRDRTGHEEAVRNFVLSSEGCEPLLEHLEKLFRFTLPRYEKEPKSYLTIAIGCTGGRHRSVAVSEELARRLGQSEGRAIAVVHRDTKRHKSQRTPLPVDVVKGETNS